MGTPRQDMISVQFAASNATELAGEIVALKNVHAPSNVLSTTATFPRLKIYAALPRIVTWASHAASRLTLFYKGLCVWYATLSKNLLTGALGSCRFLLRGQTEQVSSRCFCFTGFYFGHLTLLPTRASLTASSPNLDSVLAAHLFRPAIYASGFSVGITVSLLRLNCATLDTLKAQSLMPYWTKLLNGKVFIAPFTDLMGYIFRSQNTNLRNRFVNWLGSLRLIHIPERVAPFYHKEATI